MLPNEMLPPWSKFPHLPPGDIGWRMGGGESYVHEFCEWACTLTRDQRLDYLQRHSPLPAGWTLWAADTLALPETDEEAIDDAFGTLVDAGLISDLERGQPSGLTDSASTSRQTSAAKFCSNAKHCAPLFRIHFPAAVIIGLLISGRTQEYLALDFVWWPMMALSMEFGLWTHPLNLMMTLFVFAAVPIIQLVKWKRPTFAGRLRIAQIIIWWSYWLLFGLAGRFGTWTGP